MTKIFNFPELKNRSPQFVSVLVDMCERIGLNPNALLAVMVKESGISPSIQNKHTHATGLIQFMPNTARDLGTRIQHLAKMSDVEQLKYVEAYFTKYSYNKRIKNVGDHYLAVFWPAAIGKPADYILARVGEKAYEQNKGLDRDRNGLLQVRDVVNAVTSKYNQYEGSEFDYEELELESADTQPSMNLVIDTILGLEQTEIIRDVLYKAGDSGQEISMIQKALTLPWVNGGTKELTVDGEYGPKTEAAVKKYQSANELQADGVLGPRTFLSVLFLALKHLGLI